MKILLVVAAGLALVLVFTASCRSQQGLGGKDVRTQVTWIEEKAPKDAAHSPGEYGRKLQVGGRERFYELHVPAKFDASKPAPLVLVFHGGGGYPGAIRYESGMDAVSDRGGFLAVYPAGTTKHGYTDRLLLWNDGREYQDGTKMDVDDVAFVKAVLDDVARLVPVDEKRVYACGFSNGAQFTFVLSQRLSDRIAAIAAVAGQRSADDSNPPPKRPMSVMQFSGQQDTVGPYNGGEPKFARVLKQAEFKTMLKPVKDTIASWVKHNGCEGEPAVRTVGQAVEEKWGPCKEDTEVILWTLKDGGHAWPGGKEMPASAIIGLGHINQDINASELIWEFFSRHTL